MKTERDRLIETTKMACLHEVAIYLGIEDDQEKVKKLASVIQMANVEKMTERRSSAAMAAAHAAYGRL